MEPDFSGYVTKAGLKCSDGRTIAPDAFKHQDNAQVPLVWQHGHTDPENILGHVLLENRPDGVYGRGFFNNTAKAKHMKEAVDHKDINSMSIWANELMEKAKRVLHGKIREVSLVLAGANPGAVIDNLVIKHSDDDVEMLEDEAYIYTGIELDLSHSDEGDGSEIVHAAAGGDKTVQDIYDSMSQEQKDVVAFLVGEALSGSSDMQQSGLDLEDKENLQGVYDSMDDTQKQLLHFLVGQAMETDETEITTTTVEHSDENGNGNSTNNQSENGNNENHEEKGNSMNNGVIKHNVFENGENGGGTNTLVLSHDDMKSIVATAKRPGQTLKTAIEDYALAHGIEDIDVLFPDAKTVTDTPDFLSRRTEWVTQVLGGAKHSPFSRIKSLWADITVQEARAKGYIKGTMKKEEFFKVARRVTTPTTIYKKQKLDRDDIVDITDFDVVVWLKAEMRLMLDEELARAILVGDGRAADDEDKINEDCIRPIATDNEIYVTTVYVNIDDASSSVNEITDQITAHRSELRGTGLPTMFTSETYISKYLSLRDGLQRKVYKTIDEVATELRVSSVVPVEVLEEYTDIVAILVNMVDYVIGTDAGGNVSLFDDFDIDYNQFKYLIETRCSGALVKLKCAMVVRKTAGTDTLVTPTPPTFDGSAVTIVNTANVVYRNADTDAVINAAGSPYAVAVGDTMNVHAEPSAGHYFESSDVDDWSFTNEG